jgi:hypothetical protein
MHELADAIRRWALTPLAEVVPIEKGMQRLEKTQEEC